MQNRVKLRTLRIATFAALFIGTAASATDPMKIDVYRDANCGCCKKWVQYLKDSGLTVVDHVEMDMSSTKQKFGIPPRLSSCHTAVINGKFVEGHVPVEQIFTISNRDDLMGIAAPGMPAGSPGMEVGGKRDAYQIIGLTKTGIDEVIMDYPAI